MEDLESQGWGARVPLLNIETLWLKDGQKKISNFLNAYVWDSFTYNHLVLVSYSINLVAYSAINSSEFIPKLREYRLPHHPGKR